jgi:hypothetical protein
MFVIGNWPDDRGLIPGMSDKLLLCHNVQTGF